MDADRGQWPDLDQQQLVVRTTGGEQRTVALRPRSVVDLHAAAMAAGSFHSDAYPEPEGFRDRPLDDVPGAYFDGDLGEYLLPYRTVRTAEGPDTLALTFLRRTYEAAADLAGWDRDGLEVVPAPAPARRPGA